MKLRAEVRDAREGDLERILELVQRTNQFNTATRRRSRAELRELMDSDQHTILVGSLRDRFGALGVVAVVIDDRSFPGMAEIGSFVMSCRAIGFGLEYLILGELTAAKSDLGRTLISGVASRWRLVAQPGGPPSPGGVTPNVMR